MLKYYVTEAQEKSDADMPEKFLNVGQELYTVANWEDILKSFEVKKPKLNLDYVYSSTL